MAGTLNSVGLHLAGANSQKTAVVQLESGSEFGPVIIKQVYEKIGSFGSVFSDERVLDVLAHLPEVPHVFVDCPLTLPPCAACTRPVCPGVNACNDLSVAYMLSLWQRTRSRGGRRRRRPLNPQIQRLWDMVQWSRGPEVRAEPSFSANIFPLVIRAQTFARRMKAAYPQTSLLETSVIHILEGIAPVLGCFPGTLHQKYRLFGTGRKTREDILAAMILRGLVARPLSQQQELHGKVTASIENFHAFLCAWTSAMYSWGYILGPPPGYIEGEGWVYLPDPARMRASMLPSA